MRAFSQGFDPQTNLVYSSGLLLTLRLQRPSGTKQAEHRLKPTIIARACITASDSCRLFERRFAMPKWLCYSKKTRKKGWSDMQIKSRMVGWMDGERTAPMNGLMDAAWLLCPALNPLLYQIRESMKGEKKRKWLLSPSASCCVL